MTADETSNTQGDLPDTRCVSSNVSVVTNRFSGKKLDRLNCRNHEKPKTTECSEKSFIGWLNDHVEIEHKPKNKRHVVWPVLAYWFPPLSYKLQFLAVCRPSADFQTFLPLQTREMGVMWWVSLIGTLPHDASLLRFHAINYINDT